MDKEAQLKIIKKLSNLKIEEIGKVSSEDIKEISKKYCQASNMANLLKLSFGTLIFIIFVTSGEFLRGGGDSEFLIPFGIILLLTILSFVGMLNFIGKEEKLTVDCHVPKAPSETPYVLHPLSFLEPDDKEEAYGLILQNKESLHHLIKLLQDEKRELIYAELHCLKTFEKNKKLKTLTQEVNNFNSNLLENKEK